MCGITGIFNPNEIPSDFKDSVMRLKNKLSASEGSFSFNENFAYVIVVATMIFLEQFDSNFDSMESQDHNC